MAAAESHEDIELSFVLATATRPLAELRGLLAGITGICELDLWERAICK